VAEENNKSELDKIKELSAQLSDLNKDLSTLAEGEPEQMTWGQAANQFAQGATFNFSDEIKAGIQSIFSKKTYSELVDEERAELKEVQEKFPLQSLGYQAGGAIGSGIVAAPFTGGTSLLATGGKLALAGGQTAKGMAAAGALQGTLGAIGASEDGIDAGNVVTTAAVSAVANPIVSKTMQLFGKGIKGIANYAVQKGQGSGSQVEDELVRIINQSGLDLEEIIQRVSNGQIIPEMSEGTRNAVLGFATQGGKGAAIITDTLTTRKNKFIDETYSSLQKDLAPDTKNNNIYTTFVDNSDLLFKKESGAYTKIWANEAGKTYDNLGESILQISTGRNPQVINNFFKLLGRDPLIKMVDGKPTLLRDVTLEEGEIVKRAFRQAKLQQVNNVGKKLPAYAPLNDTENFIRRVVDDLSPDLKKTRANYAAISESVNAYNQGSTALNLPSDKFDALTRKFFDKNGVVIPRMAKELEAFRAGIASQIKAQSQRTVGTRTGQIMKLADLSEDVFPLAQRQNLERIYPNESLDSILQQINKTADTIITKVRVDAGSKTARALGEAQKVGLVGTGKLITRAVTSVSAGVPDVDAIKGLFGILSPVRAKNLPEDIQIRIAELLVADDPKLIMKALDNKASRDALLSKIDAIGDALLAGIQRGTTSTTQQQLSEVNPNIGFIGSANADELLVKDLADSLNPNTKSKIMSISGMN